MWLCDSSVGRKFIMSVTGLALVLFLLFHCLMNIVVIFSPEGYNAICEFLGANWYALIACIGLAFLMIVHLIYAFILSVQNYRARGRERYDVTKRQPGVEWASKNMLVLGVIVLGFIALHLYNFWFKMQYVEILHKMDVHVSPELLENATNGAMYISALFANWVYSLLYLVWLTALWFHLTHGVWSLFHTLGWNNNTWMPRLKCISNIVSTCICVAFAAVVLVYFFKGVC